MQEDRIEFNEPVQEPVHSAEQPAKAMRQPAASALVQDDPVQYQLIQGGCLKLCLLKFLGVALSITGNY